MKKRSIKVILLAMVGAQQGLYAMEGDPELQRKTRPARMTIEIDPTEAAEWYALSPAQMVFPLGKRPGEEETLYKGPLPIEIVVKEVLPSIQDPRLRAQFALHLYLSKHYKDHREYLRKILALAAREFVVQTAHRAIGQKGKGILDWLYKRSEPNKRNVLTRLLNRSKAEEWPQEVQQLLSDAQEVFDEREKNVNELSTVLEEFNDPPFDMAEFDRFQKLLKTGVDVNAVFEDGDTPLCKLINVVNMPEELQVDAVKKLLKHGADPNKPGKDRIPPLILAAEWNDEKLLDVLLRSGADVNVQDEKKETVTMATVQNEDASVKKLTLLLKYKPKLDLQDQDGDTALHWAVDQTRPSLVKLLLKAGANKDIRNRDGETALELAGATEPESKKAELQKIVGYLKKRG